MPDHRRIGREIEDEVAEHLAHHGYTLVTRRYSTRAGEIDIVALDGETLVFVEVKHRTRGNALEALGDVKAGRLHAAAEEYVTNFGEARRPVRFDLVTVDQAGIRLHRDFFRMGH